MTYQRIEVLSGTERRRSYTPAEKARLVEEAFRPGVVVTEAARRLGVDESLLYRWRRSMMVPPPAAAVPGFVAVAITPEPDRTDAPAPVPAAAPAEPAASPAVLEIALPCGTRVRLDGAVDPALATAVLGALVPARRAP
jgi:transposase